MLNEQHMSDAEMRHRIDSVLCEMPTQVVNRREETRHLLPGSLGAEIEFDGPDGGRHRLPLTEISFGGASFSMPYRLPGIENGTMLTDALIRVGQFEMQGNLAVLHTTRGFVSKYTYGVQFYPKTASDRNQLIGLVSHLERLPKLWRSV